MAQQSKQAAQFVRDALDGSYPAITTPTEADVIAHLTREGRANPAQDVALMRAYPDEKLVMTAAAVYWYGQQPE